MNPFDEIHANAPTMTQPFQPAQMVYDRLFTLRESAEGRTVNRSSVTNLKSLGTFRGCEPQQVQRVTTNLVSVDEGIAMQIGAFLIFTEATPVEITKGNFLVDIKTLKVYKALSDYAQGQQHKLMVIEINA